MPKEGQLRVWWIPQVPMKAFHVGVADLERARFLLGVLADYDLFQYKNHVKPDYSNAGGLEVWHEMDGWTEWEDEYGNNIDEHFEMLEEERA